ncbi:MAG: hypothetical protein HY515_04310, partial [Candidatus Aenigmarchaeota archaeon]|nr:hypothetical protein [Candidatus Aenigmarchaeota archaeon]
MEDKDKISLYCKSLAQHHSYLSRALREDGSLDLQDFLVRYQHVVDQLPSRPENKKRVSSAWDFSEKEKRALLLRAGLDGRYHTTNELVSELGLGEGSVVKTLKYAENVFGYGGRVIMDTLYLEEFDSLVRSGVEP